MEKSCYVSEKKMGSFMLDGTVRFPWYLLPLDMVNSPGIEAFRPDGRSQAT